MKRASQPRPGGAPGRVVLSLVLLVVACAAPQTEPLDQAQESRASEAGEQAIVRVGLERLSEGEDQVLRGKRLGLIVHAASVTADGRHAIDVLRGLELDVVRLFSPEHGLRGRAAAGERVDSGVDPASGLPVVSLYGAKRQPSAEDLAGLDVLVFDLQGAGVRFYTYVSTLIRCLEAAGEAGIELVVLDRPNPLGGERIEGPVSAAREVVPASFVNLAPGPLVHGLTLGEMALYVSSTLAVRPVVHVVPMSGWERDMVWSDTGRAWVSPSPNLRSAEAALAYPGTAFLEATNVSEGRGTTDPFLMIGAPWLDTSAITITTPGFDLEVIDFVPVSSPAAPNPKHLDVQCAGFRVRVSDAEAAEPYRLGVELTAQLMRQPGFEWRREGEALTWLLGTDRVLSGLVAGDDVEEIVAADLDHHESWRQERLPFLLY